MMLNHLLLGQSLLRAPRHDTTRKVSHRAVEQWKTFLHRRREAKRHAHGGN